MRTKAELIKKLQARIKKVAKLQAKIDSMPDAPVGKTGVIYEEPEHGTEVWALDDTGEVSSILNYSEVWHRELIQGLMFHDKASAINAVKVRAIRHRLAGFCAKAWENEGKVIDWDNDQQSKCHLVYNYKDNVVFTSTYYRIKCSDYFLPSCDATQLEASFTQDELKLVLTGEL